MIRKSAMMAVAGLALLSAVPAVAASPEVEAYCFAQSEAVRPALTQPEKEAYIASCIADATARQGRKPKY
jgi:hypothetical protein